jgi:tetratricopeptide (TPR) repeat protein
MRRPGTYPVRLVVLVGALVTAGALALSMIVTGNPAFPVQVFGSAMTQQGHNELAALVRPEERPALPVGRFDSLQLLPMPVLPKTTYAAGEIEDPMYREAYEAGVIPTLEHARLAVRTGRRDEALRIYETLARRLPNSRPLLLERTSVLAGFGAHAEATRLLLAELPDHPGDVELTMVAARNAWWSEQPVLSDSIVGAALAIRPGDVEALRLRQTIRSTTQPSLDVARRWAATGGAREQLILARALTNDGDFAHALPAYQRALLDRSLVTDSLVLEAASAAAAADSVDALEQLTNRYRAMRPADTEATLRLARAFAWRGGYEKALGYYAQAPAGTPGLNLEVGQVLMWSGREAEARRKLELALNEDPADATALKLLGDLASWRGDWSLATGYYSRARISEPGMPGLSAVLAIATENRNRERQAAVVAMRAQPAPDAAVSFDAFTDNFGFRYATTSAAKSFISGATSVKATALHRVFEGTTAGALSRNPGVGFRIDASRDVGRGLTVAATGGMESYSMVGSLPVYGFGLTAADVAGITVALEARHESAARSAATLAAVQTRAQSDMVSVTASRTLRAWSVWARGERESIESLIGGATRVAASASVRRELTPRLAALVNVAGLSVAQPSPQLEGFGSLLWAPRFYVEPGLGLAYRVQNANGWTFGLETTGGYAHVAERQDDQRFPNGPRPTAGLGAEILYARDRWSAAFNARYGGALGNGYRSGTFGFRASYRIGR